MAKLNGDAKRHEERRKQRPKNVRGVHSFEVSDSKKKTRQKGHSDHAQPGAGVQLELPI